MGDLTYARDVMAVRLSRTRLARIFARLAVGAVIGPVALALVAGVAHALGSDTFSDVALVAWVVGWFLGMPIATIAALIAGARYRQRARRVEVDDESLRLVAADGRARIIPRRRLTGALAVASGSFRDADVVEIGLASGDALHVELATLGAAHGLIGALGFGVAERRTVVPLGDGHDALAAGCWGVILGALVTTLSTCALLSMSSGYSAAVLGAIFVGASLLFARLLAPKRLVIGTDGLLVERSFGSRFVPLASVLGVEVRKRGLTLVFDERGAGREIALTSNTSPRSHALRERIVDAVASAARGGPEATSALIARGGRSLDAWREALRKLVGGGGYRGESVALDALLRAAESGDTPAEQRLGAAMAIGLADDAAAKQKLRIAAEGIANETMRAAMAAAAEGEGEAVEEAIEEAIAAEKRAAERR